jgi:imidazoleglycerol phosphate synthase cyclase subunit
VLHKAILRNDAGIIKALLDGGADPMFRAGNQAVALHDAVWERKHESIKALLPAYKNINYSPDGGFNGTPINLAIDRNFADIVQLFIDAGIDLRDNRNGELPLVHAAITGKADCIKVLLKAGADKISTSSAVFRNPDMIGEMVKAFGADKVTLAIDVAQNAALPSGYEVFIDGGRTATGADALEWAKKGLDYGVRTILPTSKSTDGVRTGYDLPLIRKIREITDASIVASGGAGTMEHFAEAAEAGADVLLAASVFHFHVIGIPELKTFLKARGFSVR